MSLPFFQPHPLRALRRWLAVAACLFGASAAQAQTLTSTVGLSFGSFVANTGGSIAVNAASGRSKTGGLFLMPRDTGAAAQFTVSGTADAVYAITLPADGTVFLSSGSHRMAINGFTSSPSVTGKLSLGGTQPLSIGATLTVDSAQTPGSYAGSFPVTLNYN